jgi:hypothetical protein
VYNATTQWNQGSYLDVFYECKGNGNPNGDHFLTVLEYSQDDGLGGQIESVCKTATSCFLGHYPDTANTYGHWPRVTTAEGDKTVEASEGVSSRRCSGKAPGLVVPWSDAEVGDGDHDEENRAPHGGRPARTHPTPHDHRHLTESSQILWCVEHDRGCGR